MGSVIHSVGDGNLDTTKEKETPTGEKEQQGRGGGDRGSTAARPTLTRLGLAGDLRSKTQCQSVLTLKQTHHNRVPPSDRIVHESRQAHEPREENARHEVVS